MDKVSVILTYYKKRNFFKESFISVKNQSYKNIEIIVIFDDNNHDEFKFVQSIINNNKKTILIKNKKNKGVSYSRNLGINKSSGNYIAFIDADDVWLKNKLSKQINFMKKNSLDFSCTSYSVINESGKKNYNVSAQKYISYQDLLRVCNIGLSTVIISKKIFSLFKFEKITTKEDYLLWLMLAKNNIKLSGLNLVLTNWRDVKNSLSANKFQLIIDAFRIYYVFLKKNFLISIYMTIILSINSVKKKIIKC
jgi:glycosyltransferase involved in cell wall biosynthesis